MKIKDAVNSKEVELVKIEQYKIKIRVLKVRVLHQPEENMTLERKVATRSCVDKPQLKQFKCK